MSNGRSFVVADRQCRTNTSSKRIASSEPCQVYYHSNNTAVVVIAIAVCSTIPVTLADNVRRTSQNAIIKYVTYYPYITIPYLAT